MTTHKGVFRRSLAISAIVFSGILQASLAARVDFSVPEAFDNNFWIRTPGKFLSVSENHVLGQDTSAYEKSNYYGNVVYDTNPSDGDCTNLFTQEAVGMHATITGNLSALPSLALFARVNPVTNLGVEGRIYMVSSTNMRMRLSYNVDVTTNELAEVLLDWEYNVTSGGVGLYRAGLNKSGGSGGTGFTLTAGTPYHIVLDQNGEDNSFRLSVYDASDKLMATTGFQSNAALRAVGPSGAVGFGGTAATRRDENMIEVFDFEVAP